MSDEYLKIEGGYVYDPANGIDGQVRDLWICDGVLVEPPTDPLVRPHRWLNAAGLIVMPGGVDMHCHIAGPKVNVARKMRPEEKRRDPPLHRRGEFHSGTRGSVPSTFATGYMYAGLGYTTAFDAAVPPLAARHAHEEFADTPCIDKGFFVLTGNNHYAMRAISNQEPERLRHFVAWLLGATKGYAVKLVNPGGVEVWKQRQAGNVENIDSLISGFDITPRQIIRELAIAVDQLHLPHSIHLHCNQLGMPGNWRTTLQSMEALEGHRGHFAHIQFHSYGGGDADETSFCSRVEPLADYVNQHANVTVDVGQVVFGPTTSMTGDGPLGYFLSNVYGSKWFGCDTELECGCGIAPIEYRNKSLVHALQWAIGLEWYLLVQDPWRIAMSTDHPNGGSFLAYPQIIRLLMDRNYRQAMIRTVHPELTQRCQLAEMDREYTLYEIAIITRAAPAKMLGLCHKGHLGVGADADITVYTPHEDVEQMFTLPRYVIKGGQMVVEQGDLRHAPTGDALYVAPECDARELSHIREWYDANSTIAFRNYPVSLAELNGAARRIDSASSRV